MDAQTGDLIAGVVSLVGILVVVFTQLKKEWDQRRNGRAVVQKGDVAVLHALAAKMDDIQAWVKHERERHLIKDVAARVTRSGSASSRPPEVTQPLGAELDPIGDPSLRQLETA